MRHNLAYENRQNNALNPTGFCIIAVIIRFTIAIESFINAGCSLRLTAIIPFSRYHDIPYDLRSDTIRYQRAEFISK